MRLVVEFLNVWAFLKKESKYKMKRYSVLTGAINKKHNDISSAKKTLSMVMLEEKLFFKKPNVRGTLAIEEYKDNVWTTREVLAFRFSNTKKLISCE